MYTNTELERHGFHIEKEGMDLESRVTENNEEEENEEESNDSRA